MVDQYEKESIGIFRAFDVRLAHAEFAGAFKKFSPLFVGNLSPDIKGFLAKEKIPNHDLKLYPKWGIDPMYPLLKRTDFTPWQHFDQQIIEEISKDINFFEIYEPYFFYSSQIADLANKKNRPLITEIWTSFPHHPSRFIPPYNLVINNVIKKTDYFILRSQKALSFLTPFRIPENKKSVVYHGVNVERFFPSKKSHETITLLFVGALAAHKGLDDLLDIFPDLVNKYPNRLKLIICGEGELSERIHYDAQTLPIDFRGKVSNLDLPNIYGQADIYCQPSKDYYFSIIKGGEEFAGYTFMEALACGLPIVSTYCGGIPEIVGDDNTLIIQGDKEQLFQAVDNYIKNSQLRKETGIKNRKRAENLFDLSKQVSLLENIISKNFM